MTTALRDFMAITDMQNVSHLPSYSTRAFKECWYSELIGKSVFYAFSFCSGKLKTGIAKEINRSKILLFTWHRISLNEDQNTDYWNDLLITWSCVLSIEQGAQKYNTSKQQPFSFGSFSHVADSGQKKRKEKRSASEPTSVSGIRSWKVLRRLK